MLGGQAEQQIWVDQLTFVLDPLMLVKVGKGCTITRAAHREGPSTLPMGDAVLPWDVDTTTAEGWN